MKLSQHKASAVILLVAFAVFLIGEYPFLRYDWVPVDTPIRAQSEEITAQFEAGLSGSHTVGIRFDRRHRGEYWDTVYGTSTYGEARKPADSQAVVHWSIDSDGEPLSSGVSKNSHRRRCAWSRDRAIIRLTSISARPGTRYTIRASLTGPRGIISQTSPRLWVEAIDRPTMMVQSIYITLIAAMIAIFAGLVFVGECVSRWHSKRQAARAA